MRNEITESATKFKNVDNKAKSGKGKKINPTRNHFQYSIGTNRQKQLTINIKII